MRVVRAQARFKNLPALADHFDTPASRSELACVGRSLRDAGVSLRCGNCLVAGRKAPVYTQRSRSIQAAFVAIGKRRRRRDTGTSVSSPPSRTRRILAPAPKGMRALSVGHVAPFHRGVLLLAHSFREVACLGILGKV